MKNVQMCYIRVTEGKIENLKKESKMRISTLIFIYTIHFAYLKVLRYRMAGITESAMVAYTHKYAVV